MITLIGFRCTHRKVLSREVLIDQTFCSLVREHIPDVKVGAPTQLIYRLASVVENRNNLLSPAIKAGDPEELFYSDEGYS